MRISDWSSDVCSSDLREVRRRQQRVAAVLRIALGMRAPSGDDDGEIAAAGAGARQRTVGQRRFIGAGRSEEHTSELQSLMRISYALFCLKKTTSETQTNDKR